MTRTNKPTIQTKRNSRAGARNRRRKPLQVNERPTEYNADLAVPLRCAEFFAGIGLVRLALERHGWDVVFANDIDPKKAEIYRHNWPDCDHLAIGDIHALKAEEIPPCTQGNITKPSSCWTWSEAEFGCLPTGPACCRRTNSNENCMRPFCSLGRGWRR